jgi:hypothetical protein
MLHSRLLLVRVTVAAVLRVRSAVPQVSVQGLACSLAYEDLVCSIASSCHHTQLSLPGSNRIINLPRRMDPCNDHQCPGVCSVVVVSFLLGETEREAVQRCMRVCLCVRVLVYDVLPARKGNCRNPRDKERHSVWSEPCLCVRVLVWTQLDMLPARKGNCRNPR